MLKRNWCVLRFVSPGHKRALDLQNINNRFTYLIRHVTLHSKADFHHCLLQWVFAVNESAMRFANRLFSSGWRRLLCRDVSSYTQGQSPEARIREYFYYIDHQGQVHHWLNDYNVYFVVILVIMVYFSLVKLFLDDTKVKNFVTCFKGTRYFWVSDVLDTTLCNVLMKYAWVMWSLLH